MKPFIGTVPRVVDATSTPPALRPTPDVDIIISSNNNNHRKGEKRVKSPIRRLIPLQVVPVEDHFDDHDDASERRQEMGGRHGNLTTGHNPLDEGVEAVRDGARTILVEPCPRSAITGKESAGAGAGAAGAAAAASSAAGRLLSPRSSVQDVLHSIKTAVQAVRSREEDDNDDAARVDENCSGLALSLHGAGGWEVSHVLTEAALDELLRLPDAETPVQDDDTPPVLSSAESTMTKRRLSLWKTGGGRRDARPRHKSGGFRGPSKPRRGSRGAPAPEHLVRPHAVQPCIPETAHSLDAAAPARTAKERGHKLFSAMAGASAHDKAASSPRGPMVKILPFVERPKKRLGPTSPGRPPNKSSYDLPSLLSSSIHESRSDGNMNAFENHESEGKHIVRAGGGINSSHNKRSSNTNIVPEMLLCTAVGVTATVQCYADPKEAGPDATSLLKCNGDATGSTTGSGSTAAATASSTSDDGSGRSRPRVVSFETNPYGASGSVVSIIGTASTVTSVEDEDEADSGSGSVLEIESVTTPSGSSSSSVPSAFKDPVLLTGAQQTTKARASAIVDRVRDASCQLQHDASGASTNGEETQDGSDSETDSSAASNSSASSSSSGSGPGAKCGRPSVPGTDDDEDDGVATLDEALQSGRRWLW